MRGHLTLDRTFGGILAWDSIFHLPAADQRLMFPIFDRHAAPGAGMIITSGPSTGERIGSYQGEPLHHARLDAAEYRALLGANGFDVVAHVVEDPDCGLHTIWLARLVIRWDEPSSDGITASPRDVVAQSPCGSFTPIRRNAVTVPPRDGAMRSPGHREIQLRCHRVIESRRRRMTL